jgi:hypothetical protein
VGGRSPTSARRCTRHCRRSHAALVCPSPGPRSNLLAVKRHRSVNALQTEVYTACVTEHSALLISTPNRGAICATMRAYTPIMARRRPAVIRRAICRDKMRWPVTGVLLLIQPAGIANKFKGLRVAPPKRRRGSLTMGAFPNGILRACRRGRRQLRHRRGRRTGTFGRQGQGRLQRGVCVPRCQREILDIGFCYLLHVVTGVSGALFA